MATIKSEYYRLNGITWDKHYFKTAADMVEGLNIKSKMLTGELQVTSYRKSVVALVELSGGINASSYSIGTLTFHRTNGLTSPVKIDFALEKLYNTEKMTTNYSVMGSLGFTAAVKPCTFTYNGKKYGGFEVFFSDAELSIVEFYGNSNFAPFGLDYYNTNGNTVLISEVYNSLDFSSASINKNTPVIRFDGDIMAARDWVKANTRSNIWVPTADIVSETASRVFVTPAEKNKISTYLDTFNTKNKLLKLDEYGKIPATLISGGLDYLPLSGGEMSGAINLAENEIMNAGYIWGTDGQALSFSSSNGEGVVSIHNGYKTSIELKNDILSLGNKRITNLDDGVGAKDAINKSQLTWNNITGKPPSFAPSDAQKNSDITKAEIEAKLKGVITSHTHNIAQVTNLQTELNNRVTNSALSLQLQEKLNIKPNGTDDLIINGEINSKYVGQLFVTDVHEVSSQAAMLALKIQKGDIAIRSDLNQTFILKQEPASVLANWVVLSSNAKVLSVAGKTGVVVLGIGDISGLQAALNAKLDVSGGEMSGAINMADNEIQNVGYIWGSDGQSLSFSSSNSKGIVHINNGGSSSVYLKDGLLDLGTNRITNLSDGVGAKDAINKSQLTWANLSGKPSTFSPSTHNHPISQITGLQTALNGKVDRYQSVNGLDMNNVTETGFYYGYNMTNAAVATISTFMVINYSPDWIIQKQFIPSAGGNREFIRSRHSGTTWSSWAELPDKTWVTSNTRSSSWMPTAAQVGARPAGNVPWAEISGKPSLATESWVNSEASRPQILGQSNMSSRMNEAGLRWTQSSTGGPTNSWHHVIRTQHNGYANGYFRELVMPFGGGANKNALYVRSVENGTDSGYVKIASESWVSSNTRSSGWMPTAAQVGARPSDWTPSDKDIPTLQISKISQLRSELDNKVSGVDFTDFAQWTDTELRDKASITSVNNLVSLKSNTDNRSTNTSPNLYNSKFMIAGLKTNTVIGISSSKEGTYSSVLGIRGWSDVSGGRAHEIAFGGKGGLYHRSGDSTVWDSGWAKLWDSGSLEFKLLGTDLYITVK